MTLPKLRSRRAALSPRSLGLIALVLLAIPALGLASGGHDDPLIPVMYTMVLVIMAGRLGGDLAARAGQPEVLGELVAGVLLGNLGLFGLHHLDYLKDDGALTLLAGIGVVLLLFEVGLESTVGDMLKVGASSLAVATLGVIAPFFLGWGVGAWLRPDESIYVHIFLGATLTATSVGITARVLQELRRSRDKEARIILGAAVLDDVMGLVILAVVTGLIAAVAAGESLSLVGVASTTGTAVGFLVGAMFIGHFTAPIVFKLTSQLRANGVLLATAFGFCFLLAGLAGTMGLAPIVGAFAAGLLLEDVHFREIRYGSAERLEELTKPIVSWLAPFFFVQMGSRVDLSTFAQTEVLGFAAALTVAAVIGKQACSLGVLEKGVNRFAVGLGMIPRGEVGLIFAQIGHSLVLDDKPLIDGPTYSAVVIMVIVTTVVTPGLLKRSLGVGPTAES